MNPPLQKIAFTTALAHDLRGPLGAITSAAAVMKLLSARMEVQNPKDAELMAQAQAVIARQTENLTRMIDDMLSAAQAEVQPESPLAESGACRVLVIEDNEDTRDSLRVLLELEGHSVATAEDGPQGLTFLLDECPDVAIIDIGLPGLSGFELARRSRRAGYAGQLLALSGHTSDADRAHALRNGFDAYLPKPFDASRLRRLMPGAHR